jgi:hypothetical protein
MKKNLVFLFLTVFLAINAFGTDFSISVGGGGLLGYTFTRYTLEGGGANSTQSMDRINYGGFLFFDATYIEFSFLIQGGYNSYKESMIFNDESLPESRGTGTELSLGFSLMGKYPLIINENLCWFPMLGLEYHIALVQRRQPDGDIVYDRTKG